jgi:hypothetical protein
MKLIVWLCFLCILAGCSSQVGARQPTKPSAQSEPLQTALGEKASVDGGSNDAMNSVTTIPVPENGKPVVARAGVDGTIHLLYDSAIGPKYVMSNDNGKTFDPPVSVVGKESQKAGLAFEGWDMVVGKASRVHVALSTNAWKLKLPQEEWGFHYTSLESGTNAFAPVRNINRKPSEGFSLAADVNGKVTACWLSGKLYANVSHDDGKTFGPVEIAAGYDPCNCCTTSAVYGVDGNLAVLYREETNNERDMFLILWDQDHRQESRTRISSTPWKTDGCPMTYYAISRNEGGFVAVWPTKGQVYFARLDGKGNVLPPGEIKTSGRAGMRTGVLALSATNGSTLIAWRQGGWVKWQLYDANGHSSGSVGSANSAGNGVAGVVDKYGHFILFK